MVVHLADVVALFVLAIPVAAVSWTVTHEEIVREAREYCQARSRQSTSWATRKFFYVFTCEYCFSHWVAAGTVGVTGFQLLLPGWRGYAIAWLSLVGVANVYMAAFARLKLEVKQERLELARQEQERTDT
jgi:Trk-type K+ transport system membrane component